MEVSINRPIPRLAWLALLFFSSLLWADEDHHHALTQDEIGSVNFVTSCSHEMTADFNRAVALLHSFQYEQSRGMFEEIAKNDPDCAMAEWGIAMSHYHGLWQNGDIEAGRVALQKAKQMASSNKNTTTREKSYIDNYTAAEFF